MTTTDPLITKYLPIIRGHVTNKYAWMEKRGNCLIGLDDLMQIAAISLVHLVGKWDDILAERGETRDDNEALFGGYLKQEVRGAVRDYYQRFTGRKLDGMIDPLDAINNDGEEMTSPADVQVYREWVRMKEDPASGKAVLHAVADFFDTMPAKDKVYVALRYHDELPLAQVADVLSLKSVSTELYRITDRWRDFARNQYTDETVFIPDRVVRGWEAPGSLLEYIRARHRMDLHEYLGVVSIRLHADPVYLAKIFARDTANSPYINEERRTALSPYMQAQIDRMYHDGAYPTEIARLTGLTLGVVLGHLKSRHTAF